MIQLLLSTTAAILLAFIAYTLGADITGNTIGAIVFAVIGFAVGWWVAALVFARTRRGRDTVR